MTGNKWQYLETMAVLVGKELVTEFILYDEFAHSPKHEADRQDIFRDITIADAGCLLLEIEPGKSIFFGVVLSNKLPRFYVYNPVTMTYNPFMLFERNLAIEHILRIYWGAKEPITPF